MVVAVLFVEVEPCNKKVLIKFLVIFNCDANELIKKKTKKNIFFRFILTKDERYFGKWKMTSYLHIAGVSGSVAVIECCSPTDAI